MIKTSSDILTFLIFLVPFTLLIFDQFVLFPYITTKALVFRSIITIAITFALIPIFFEPRKFLYFFKKNYLIITVLIFLLSQVLANIFSLNPYRSFWGNAERMEGLWSLFFYILYFFILTILFAIQPERKKLIFYSFLIVSVLISLIEIQQYITLRENRPSATLGNPTYIGFFNLLNIFLIAYFMFGEENKIIKVFLVLSIILNFISLITSETRGSILGLLLGLLVGVIFYILSSRSSFKKKFLILSSVFLLFLLFLGFILSPFSQFIPGFNRLRETIYNPISIFPRIFAWKIFLDGFRSSPIVGYGQETEPIVFFKFFDPKIYEYEAAIFDRPHNKFVQILVNSGLIGYISWILIFISTIYLILKSREMNELQKSSFIGFIFAYLGQNFSLFDIQASYLPFFFALSLLTEKLEIKFNEEKFVRPLIIISAGLSLIIFIFHLQHYYIVRKIIDSLRIENPLIASREFLRLAQVAGPFLTEEAIMASNYFYQSISKIKDLETFNNFYELIRKAYYKEKTDVRLISIYSRFLRIMISLNESSGNYDKYLDELKKLMNFSINFYPRNYELRFMFVTIFYDFSKVARAEKNNQSLTTTKPIEVIRKSDLMKILEEGEIYAKKSPAFYSNYLRVLDLLDSNEAYQKGKDIIRDLNIIKSKDLLLILMDIFHKNNDVENLKRVIELSKSYSHDEEIKRKIIFFENSLFLSTTSSEN